MTSYDPRATALAKARRDITHHNNPALFKSWDDLTPIEQQLAIDTADAWLRAAITAGIVPAAECRADNLDLLHVDPSPDVDTAACHWTDCPLNEGHDNPHPTA
ncbi:hypothetical protein ACWC4D_33410 [Streptomyces sp. NPDC001288]